MKLQIFTVDAFSEKPFEGNPAAIIPLTQKLSDAMMQQIAFEMNLSETAYVTPPCGDSADSQTPFTTGDRFGLRWFTPTHEVPLCGHATLAAAHTLFYILGNSSSTLAFETLSGTLFARKQDGGIVLDFPSNPPKPLSDSQSEQHSSLVKAIARGNEVKEVLFSPTTGKLLIRLEDCHSRSDLESIQPNKEELLKTNDGSEVRGVILCLQGGLHSEGDDSRGVGNHHFVSRYFAPWLGIHEDPVTGSAHTVLAPYWSNQLGIKDLTCRQCSKRGGELRVTVRTDGRVDIFGRGTTVIQGQINVSS